MTTLAVPMASPSSLKRSYDEAGLEEPPGVALACSTQVKALPTQSEQANEPSQASRDMSVSNNPVTSVMSAVLADPVPQSAQTPAKKPNLTFDEKEVQRIEKEFKAREKAEEKAKKEEEKARKETEKLKKEEGKKAREALKEDKRRVKEAQAQAKQEEKRLKEEEKQRQEDIKIKKARSQLRLNSFFTQPSIPNATSSVSIGHDVHSPMSSRRSSIGEIQAMESARRSRSASTTPQKPRLPDYEREFPSFYLASNTSLAPYNRFSHDVQGSLFVQQNFDDTIPVKQEIQTMTDSQSQFAIRNLLRLPLCKRHRRRPQNHTVKDILAVIDGSTSNPIDLTDSKPKKAGNPIELLKTVPLKFLKFAEDVRPPYIGTYTRLQGDLSISKQARNPFSRGLPDTNYDYDSEAEWEEPVEGEDLNSEGEEEPEDDEEGDEMAGFLDDEGAADPARAVKRRPLLGNQEPISTGLCWAGSKGQPPDQGSDWPDWRLFQLDILLETPKTPIDPYSTEYWTLKPTSSPHHSTSQTQNSLMEPPRMPLHPINRQNTLFPPPASNIPLHDAKTDSTAPMKPPKIHRHVSSDLMEEFKAVVQGNDLTKLGLLEILKKKFPKEAKDAIKDTLEMIAERVGPRPSEKRWMLRNGV